MTLDQSLSTRRDVLRKGAAGAGIGALAVAGAPVDASARPRRRPTFVFVHGGWSSGFNFHKVLLQLVTEGRRAVAVDLPGHGQEARFPASYLTQDLAALATEPSPSAGITLAACVDRVTRVVRQIARESGPVVLLGHSSGGIVIGRVASAVPQLVHRVVYMSAYLVAKRERAVDYFDPRGVFPGVEELDVLRVNWRSPDTRSFMKPGLFPLSSDAVYTAFSNTWQPDFPFQLLTASSRVDKRTWGKVPRSYVRFADDGTIRPDQQDVYIAEADALTPRNATDVHTVRGGHIDPFASATELVRVLARLR